MEKRRIYLNDRDCISLRIIKIIHTIIWLLMFLSVFYVFYSGLSGDISFLSWFGVGLIFIEGLALIIGKGDCPLHLCALQLTGETSINDTYLPEWIFFKHYKLVLSAIFLIGLALMICK